MDIKSFGFPILEPKVEEPDLKTNQTITLENLEKIIEDNVYVKKTCSGGGDSKDSLSFLIDRELTQSDKIKLGIGYEKILSDIIMNFTSYENIKPKNKKGEKETDHLFRDNENKIIFYAELKTNLNLDTEKNKSTSKKILKIVDDLRTNPNYEDYELKFCLLGARYIHSKDIRKTLMDRYKILKAHVFGINEYLEMLKIDFKFTEETYKKILNHLADKMFC